MTSEVEGAPRPDGWRMARLDEIAIWGSGGTPRRSESNYFGGGIPWVTISDLNDGQVSETSETLSEDGLNASSAKLVPPDAVMVALYGSIGKLGLSTKVVTTNQAIAYAIPDNASFHYLYLFHFLRSQRENLASLGTGVTQKNIYLGDLKAFQMPVAPRTEQTRIVEKLEELLSDLDAGVAELNAAQRKLAQYRQSLLKAAVEGALTADWRAARASSNEPQETGADLLQRILTERRTRWEARQRAKFVGQGKTPPKDWQAKYPEPVTPDTTGLPALPGGWTWASIDQLSPDDLANGRSVPSATTGAKVLRLTAVKNGRIALAEFKHGAWTVEEAQQFSVIEGDLLIVRGNGSLALVGRAGLVPEVTEQVAYPDTMIRLRIIDSVVRTRWVAALWDSALVRNHLEQRARTSAGIYKISQPDIVTTIIPVPPIAEQDEMLTILDRCADDIQAIQEAAQLAERQAAAQRKNILKAAFAGQLVPQDPDDEPASVLLERIRAERTVAGTVKGRSGRKIAGSS